MQKTLAIAISETDYRDNDKIITLFSPAQGKIDVLSRGCKKSSSKLLASSQLFSYGDFYLNESKGKYYHSGCDIKYTYYGLRDDYTKLACGCFYLELVGQFIIHDQSSKRLFALLLNSLYSLEQSINTPQLTTLIFMIKLLDYIGLRPNTEEVCEKCATSQLYFCYSDGIVMCKECSKKYLYEKDKITREQCDFIEKALSLSSKDICEKLSLQYDKKLTNIIYKFISHHTHKKIKSYKMLDL